MSIVHLTPDDLQLYDEIRHFAFSLIIATFYRGRSHCVRRRTTTYVSCMQINAYKNNKIATEDDLYGVVLASISYLYTFGTFSRRRN